MLWRLSGCLCFVSVVCSSLRQSGYEKRIICIREIRMNGDPDDNACHVSLWDACHVFLR